MDIKLRKINDKYVFSDLCGLVFYRNGIKCTINQYDAEFGKIHILIDQHGTELYMTTEAISFAFGVDDFIERMKLNYDINIIPDETVALFDGDIVTEALKLRQFGFDRVEVDGDRIIAKSSEDPDMELDVTKKMKQGMEVAVPFSSRRTTQTIKLEDMFKHLLY